MIRDITIGQYYPAQSPIHKLDPRVKIVSTLLYLISLFLFRSVPGYLVATIFLFGCIGLSKVPVKFILKGLKPIFILLLITILFNLFLTTGGRTLLHVWVFRVTEEGLRTAVYMAIRLIYLIMGASLMTFTTTPTALTDAIESLLKPLNRVHVPVHEIAIPAGKRPCHGYGVPVLPGRRGPHENEAARVQRAGYQGVCDCNRVRRGGGGSGQISTVPCLDFLKERIEKESFDNTASRDSFFVTINMTDRCHVCCVIVSAKGGTMKIDRLIGILSVLLQKEKVTAPELASRFEVSRRTINRDIEDLCMAGIPVVTEQGRDGGISILENFRLDRTVLTRAEMQDILAGLRSLDSVNGTNRYGQLMEKLSTGSSDFLTGNQSVLIDLSSWYKTTLAPKIEQIRYAIEGRRLLMFRYFAPSGESLRRIEPYYLVFRWSSWYVWGWCESREDFRMFKLNRMEELCVSEEIFTGRKVPMPDLSNERIFPGGIQVEALFEASCKWRLVEEFGQNCFEEQEDGRLLFHADYTSAENLLSWLLTFGDQVELKSPKELRGEMKERIRRMAKRYEEISDSDERRKEHEI